MTAKQLANPSLLPSVVVKPLGKACPFAECRGKSTQQTLPLCRVLLPQHSAKIEHSAKWISKVHRKASLPSSTYSKLPNFFFYFYYVTYMVPHSNIITGSS